MQDIYDRKLSIYLTAGQDDEGKDIVKAKSFSNVRLDTTDALAIAVCHSSMRKFYAVTQK